MHVIEKRYQRHARAHQQYVKARPAREWARASTTPELHILWFVAWFEEDVKKRREMLMWSTRTFSWQSRKMSWMRGTFLLFPFPRSHTGTRFKEQQGERVRANESVLWNVSGWLTSSGDFGCENDFHTDAARGMRFEFPAQLIAFRRARLSELEFNALTLYFPRCNFASRSPRIEFESIRISLFVAQLS